mmetsp:Transcript_16121/g.29938  ORF Transcript_16121/g.29938 Transcript_16121/m.29938 type:complete len:239 (-) Transcript_16121:94-810(-)
MEPPQSSSVSFSAALEESLKVRQAGKSKKRVSLSDSPTVVHEVKSLQDYSEEEIEQTWFTRKEFDDIKTSYRDLLRRMRNKEYIKDTDDCSTRGLEGRSRAGARNRQSIIMESILSVLNEQMEQEMEGRNDPEAIAIAYRQYGYHSLQAAQNMARRDQDAIAQYQLSDYAVQAGGSIHNVRQMTRQDSSGSATRRSNASIPNLGLSGGRRSFTDPVRRTSKVAMAASTGGGRRRAAAA